MKITVLLCSLATIAVAVPTNHNENLQEQDSVPEKFPATIQREKKSPLHDHHAAGLTDGGSEDLLTQANTKSSQRLSTMEGRSLGFKKPIIVKKKIGYHVYRDSDEEMAHADPHENCRKQIKVKLCDEEPGSPKHMVNCIAAERLNEDITEKEIENSIKTAKEAVENLQRGLHKMEHNSAKLTHIEDKELEDDLVVHQHIEAARQALEHVQQNFGNLDTLNLQATSPKADDFQSKSSDEERLAQWKEAIDNIQKNFEIARNIEDAFKADSDQTNLESSHVNDASKTRESEHAALNVDSHHKSNSDASDTFKEQRDNSEVDMFTAPTEHKELKIKLHSDSLRSEQLTEEPLRDHETKTKSTEKSKEHVASMKSSKFIPMADVSLKTEGLRSENPEEFGGHHHQLKVVNDVNLPNEQLKSLDINTHDLKLETEKNALAETQDMIPFLKEKSADAKSFEDTSKHLEHDMSMESSNIHTHQSHLEVKHSLNNEKEKTTHEGEKIVAKTSLTDGHAFDQSLKAKSVHDTDEHHKHTENVQHGISELIHEKEINMPHHTHINTNSAQDKQRNSMNFNNMRSEDEKHFEFTPTNGFNNEQQNVNVHSFMKMIEDQNMDHKFNEMHDMHNLNDHSGMRMTEDQNKYNSFLMRWAHENQQRIPELSLSQDFNAPKEGQHFHNEHTNMRINQDHNTGEHSNHQLFNPQSTQWINGKQQNEQSQLAKTTNALHETTRSNEHQNIQNQLTDDHNLHELFLMRLAQEKQQNDHLKTTPEFHNRPDLSQLGPRMHEHMHIMKHAMSPDMDSAMIPSMHMNMRDASGKSAFDHNDMHWNHHHHATARYGSGLPITGASPGAVGVFPNANTGSCGIPLMLSCSPSVVSGTLAKAQPHLGTITAPSYRSGDDVMFYMKRDAKDTDELPTIKIQKSSVPFNHKSELIFEKTQ